MGPHQQRPSFFALHFQRLLVRTKAAHTIGAEGFTLLAGVILAEDRIAYRYPVPFWASELQELLGVKESAVKRTRKRCVGAGWLGFLRRHKQASLYWTTVPDPFKGMIEEVASGQTSGPEFLQAKNDPSKLEGSKMTPQADRKRTASGLLSSPFPAPVGGGAGNELEKTTRPGSGHDPRYAGDLFATVAEVTGLDAACAADGLMDAASRLAAASPPFTPDKAMRKNVRVRLATDPVEVIEVRFCTAWRGELPTKDQN